MINIKKIIGTSRSQYHTLDQSTPWFEFLSYQECCLSLKRPCKIGSFIRYHQYLREIGLTQLQ